MNNLFLTPAEKLWFDRLPQDLQEGWVVQPEDVSAYETDEALRIRSHMARFDSYPELKTLIENARTGKPTKDWKLDDVPDDLLPTVFFTIGAKGIGAMISALLTQIADDQDLQGLASLTAIRRDLLAANASTPSI